MPLCEPGICWPITWRKMQRAMPIKVPSIFSEILETEPHISRVRMEFFLCGVYCEYKLWFMLRMMTSSNGNIFRVTGHLCGEFTVPGEFPARRPVTRSFDVFFDLRPNKRLNNQWWGWWFETPSSPLWRHCNGLSRCSAVCNGRLGWTVLHDLYTPLYGFSLA